MRLLLLLVSLSFLIPCHGICQTKVTVKGKLSSGAGYQVVFIDGKGAVSLKRLQSSGAFSFKTKNLKGSTLALLDQDGRALGPIVLAGNKGKRKAYLGFSGKLIKNSTTVNLGSLTLADGYAKTAGKLPTALVSTRGNLVSNTDADGVPLGAASGGISSSSFHTKRSVLRPRAGDGLSSPAADTDADGIIDALDPDLDGDGIANIADPDFAGNDDATFSSLVVNFSNTLNANIGAVTQEAIDAVIGGSYMFNIGFWFSLPSESPITGGHVICADSNSYCNRTTGTAVFSGLTESDSSLVGQLWRSLNQDGSGYPNLELMDVRGFSAVAAAIEPRVGTGAVRPGDTYLLNYTRSGGAVVSNKLLVLAPYMVTVPALKSYTAGGAENVINYADISSQPGSISNPILTDSTGSITLTFWRPQRLLYRSETPSSESDRYRDMGHLKYGVVFEGVSRQFTCAGLYSSISPSGELSESGITLGSGGSPYPDDGAELFSLRDQTDDALPSPERVLSFTVDLRGCLARAGQPVGTYSLRLIARGEELSGGANSSSQMFSVTVQ